jgi:nucleoid DNA-binding protein
MAKKEKAEKQAKKASKKEAKPTKAKEVQKRTNIKSVADISEKLHGMYSSVPKATIIELVKDTFQVTKNLVMTLKEGESLSVYGFGSFRVLNKKPRKARNPKTGETIDVPAKKALKFRPTSMMKLQLNESKTPKSEAKSTKTKKAKKSK